MKSAGHCITVDFYCTRNLESGLNGFAYIHTACLDSQKSISGNFVATIGVSRNCDNFLLDNSNVIYTPCNSSRFTYTSIRLAFRGAQAHRQLCAGRRLRAAALYKAKARERHMYMPETSNAPRSYSPLVEMSIGGALFMVKSEERAALGSRALLYIPHVPEERGARRRRKKISCSRRPFDGFRCCCCSYPLAAARLPLRE